jgi:hypothetical protein
VVLIAPKARAIGPRRGENKFETGLAFLLPMAYVYHVHKPQKGLSMIQTAQEMLTALRKGVFTGVILYEGASALDGAPIVVIANRITDASTNSKTRWSRPSSFALMSIL